MTPPEPLDREAEVLRLRALLAEAVLWVDLILHQHAPGVASRTAMQQWRARVAAELARSLT